MLGLVTHLSPDIIQGRVLVVRADKKTPLRSNSLHECRCKVEVRERVNNVNPLSMFEGAAFLSYRVTAPLKRHLLIRPHPGVIRHCNTRGFKINEVERVR